MHNLELNAGLEYVYKFKEKYSLNFILGYRYNLHTNVMTDCGQIEQDNIEKNPFAICRIRGIHVSDSYSIKRDYKDLILHGPFLRTTFNF